MKVDKYKGYEEAQISKMSIEEFMKLTTSRERRTLKNMNKHPALKKLVMKVRKLKESGKTKGMIKTQVREAIVIPEWLGLTFGIYNGKEYKRVEITVNHLGKRLGDFAHTTGPVKHSGPGVGATRGSKFVPLK